MHARDASFNLQQSILCDDAGGFRIKNCINNTHANSMILFAMLILQSAHQIEKTLMQFQYLQFESPIWTGRCKIARIKSNKAVMVGYFVVNPRINFIAATVRFIAELSSEDVLRWWWWWWCPRRVEDVTEYERRASSAVQTLSSRMRPWPMGFNVLYKMDKQHWIVRGNLVDTILCKSKSLMSENDLAREI